MWADTVQWQYACTDLALQSDLIDAEWAVLEPFFPPPYRVGRPGMSPLWPIVEGYPSGETRGRIGFQAATARV